MLVLEKRTQRGTIRYLSVVERYEKA